MKSLYTSILARLKAEVSTLKWIDLDTGQLDSPYMERPTVAFPCALLGLQIGRADNRDMRAKTQICQGIVTIRLAWDFTPNTHGKLTNEKLAANLAYFDLVQSVHAALQGYQDGYNPLTRTSHREERRADNIKVVTVTYTTEYIDVVPPPAPAPDPEP